MWIVKENTEKLWMIYWNFWKALEMAACNGGVGIGRDP